MITISLDSGFQDLEIKVTVGSLARSRSLLVAPSGPPTLSLLLLKCTGRDFSKQEEHTPKASTRGGINAQRGFKQTEPGAGIKHRVMYYHIIINCSEYKA